MLSTGPPIAFSEIVTLSVVVLSLLRAAITRDVGETLSDHPALSVADREYVSETFSLLLSVKLYVSVTPFNPLWESGEIASLLPRVLRPYWYERIREAQVILPSLRVSILLDSEAICLS
jgi:hypothetical protein